MSTIRVKRKSRKWWESKNPILANGEPGMDSTMNRLKIGNGVSGWNELEYLASTSVQLETIDAGGP